MGLRESRCSGRRRNCRAVHSCGDRNVGTAGAAREPSEWGQARGPPTGMAPRLTPRGKA
jgi:hypothetical protein